MKELKNTGKGNSKMQQRHDNNQLNLLKSFWITSDIFSTHYLLERLPQAGPKIWPTDEEILPTYNAVRELYERNIVTINPSDRKTQELFEKHFTKSMSVLSPLKEKIKATDELIDQIVYKLYGLTPDEIAIVEGSK